MWPRDEIHEVDGPSGEVLAALERRIGELQAEITDLLFDADFGVLTRKGFRRLQGRLPEGRRVIAFLDFDHIKRLNEKLGYTEVNRRIAATLSAVRRKGDVPVRWFSGDEIVIHFAGDARQAHRRLMTLQRRAHARGLGFTWALGTWVAGAESLETAVERAATRVLRQKRDRDLSE